MVAAWLPLIDLLSMVPLSTLCFCVSVGDFHITYVYITYTFYIYYLTLFVSAHTLTQLTHALCFDFKQGSPCSPVFSVCTLCVLQPEATVNQPPKSTTSLYHLIQNFNIIQYSI